MEAVGAAKWIDKHLAPPDKKVVIDQWSGDCEPDAQVVGLAYKAGLMNINGGESLSAKKIRVLQPYLPSVFFGENGCRFLLRMPTKTISPINGTDPTGVSKTSFRLSK
jgi:hypothetical protein